MNGRLSHHPNLLKSDYDAVIVGSGYGGGVAAARLARCGMRVCLLERGREIAVGEFPSRPSQMVGELQVESDAGRIGHHSALFDVRLGSDVDVLLGCGLGGTSLINANVCLEPDPRTFEDRRWPEPIRTDGVFAEGLQRARAMLRPQPYSGQPTLRKLENLTASAIALGATSTFPPLHVAFAEGSNAAGVRQAACTLCGDCCAGCNVGAKTTVALTYLPLAARHGAEIFSGLLVRSLQKRSDGRWQIDAVVRQPGPRGKSARINAAIVVLAAGTLGSTEILLRSRAQGLAVSELVGEHLTSNGDVIAISYNNRDPVNSIGTGYPPKLQTDPVGPAVAGLIDLRAAGDLDRGLVVVDASIPSTLAPLLPGWLALAGSAAAGAQAELAISDQVDALGRAVSSLIEGAYQGPVGRTQTYLAVSHDSGRGRLVLDRDRLKIDWPGAALQEVFQRIDATLGRMTEATGGTYIARVLAPIRRGKVLTVHPLGGCAMGEDRSSGVVNHKGQVFDASSASSSQIHPGLYVCDGAVVPRSLGVHPLLTITALAERAMIHLIRDRYSPTQQG